MVAGLAGAEVDSCPIEVGILSGAWRMGCIDGRAHFERDRFKGDAAELAAYLRLREREIVRLRAGAGDVPDELTRPPPRILAILDKHAKSTPITALARDASALILAVREAVPGLRVALMLAEDGRLAVQLCDVDGPPERRFETATLDDDDLDRPAADVAADIARFRTAERARTPTEG